MTGDTKTIEHLNTVLGNELIAINQYLLHASMYKDWGISALGKKEYTESIDEITHADNLIERILFLDGLPNLQKLGKLKVGNDTLGILKCDLELERESSVDLQEAIIYSESCNDPVSRELFQDILENEEKHINWLETQIELVAKMGIEDYIQHQMTPN